MENEVDEVRRYLVAKLTPVRNEVSATAPVPVKMEEDTSTPLQAAKEWNASATQPTYTPQFSATTSLILSRIKGEQQISNSASSNTSPTALQTSSHVSEKARNSLLENMNASLPQNDRGEWPTLNQSSVSTEIAGSGRSLHQDEISEGSGAGVKRKREDSDFTENTIAMPTPSPAMARQQPTGTSSSRSEPSQAADSRRPIGQRDDALRRQKIERTRQKRIAALPEGVVPAKPELIGFGSGAASSYARSEYFQNMKRTDLLNLLSFCDQLRPQLLVDIMVSVSKRHPDLPMFSSPDWAEDIAEPSTPMPKALHKRPIGRTRHGPSLLNSKAKQKIKGNTVKAMGKKPHKRSRLAEEMLIEDPQNQESQEAEEEDPLPPTWPKAGEGLYAKLVAETQDRSFLADDNDEEAFSHFMVDKMGRQIIDPV